MQDRLSVQVYIVEGELIFVPGSITADYSVVFELPPDRVALAADDVVVGTVALQSAERCRGVVSEPATRADDMARALGFKSESELRRKSKMVSLSRRNGAPTIDVLPTRKEKGRFVYSDVEMATPMSSPAEVGRAIKKAAELSTG